MGFAVRGGAFWLNEVRFLRNCLRTGLIEIEEPSYSKSNCEKQILRSAKDDN